MGEARLPNPVTGQSASVEITAEKELRADGPDFSVELIWPDYVITDLSSGRRWSVSVLETYLLSLVDGKRSIPQLVAAARSRLELRNQGLTIKEADLMSAFLRLSMGDILTGQNEHITVNPKYAEFTSGSLSGSIATLLLRAPDFPCGPDSARG